MLSILLFGCNSGTNDSNNSIILNGLYEGIPTYTGTGYTPLSRIEYFRIDQNEKFMSIGLELIAPFRSQFPANLDTSFKYAQFFMTSGDIKATSDSVCYTNQLTGISEKNGVYDTSSAEKMNDYCLKIKFNSPDQFSTQIVGGGSNADGTSYEYYMTYTKIGNLNDSIPRLYYVQSNQ